MGENGLNRQRTKRRTRPDYDVIIVGAGAAGIGVARVFKDLGLLRYTVLERDGVAASFLRWPAEMRFITPSFPSNGFGALDLNSITLDTSPAYSLGLEHPTGKEYAVYLQAIVRHFELPVQTGVDVQQVEPVADGFRLSTSRGQMTCRFVVWAAGEFQYPNRAVFPGAEMCIHNADVRSWKDMAGDEFVVVGGYESGIDAAVNLVRQGASVRVIDDTTPWEVKTVDPSVALSPYTQRRLRMAQSTGRLELIAGGVERVTRTTENGTTHYHIAGEAGECWQTQSPPILATGFVGSLTLLRDRLEAHPELHYPLLTENDESTLTPGLFLAGPLVRHQNVIFCFIYKFRQRFAVVANAIATRLGLDPEPLAAYRAQGMYLDDLSCCEAQCVC